MLVLDQAAESIILAITFMNSNYGLSERTQIAINRKPYRVQKKIAKAHLADYYNKGNLH